MDSGPTETLQSLVESRKASDKEVIAPAPVNFRSKTLAVSMSDILNK